MIPARVTFPFLCLGALLLLFSTACGEFLREPGKQEWEPPVGAAAPGEIAPREPCAHRNPLRQAFFGDLHVHTRFSMDADAWGLTLGPDDAYRFALGEPVALFRGEGRPPGQVRIDRPLDFAAVTDHAEWMAEVALCRTPGSPVYESESCLIFRGDRESWLARILNLRDFGARIAGIAGALGRKKEVCGRDGSLCRDALYDVWQATQASAERFYDRSAACRFTTFHAYEYSYTPGRSKTHRNVIFANEIVPELPLSWIDTPSPELLWQRLRELCTESDTGCDAIAIPHNPNLSNGRMFAIWYRDRTLEEQRAQAALRAELEPLVEMMQVKGESECRNDLPGVMGGPDELCGFEKMRDFPGESLEDCGDEIGSGGEGGKGCISRLDYARYALIEGLREEARIGVNPYRFGLIGSTDGHAATPGSVDEVSPGIPLGRVGQTVEERLELDEHALFSSAVWRNPGALVGVWAEENSREALFTAMRRREAFATSGPRIRPRLFAGWELPEDLCTRPDAVEAGYAEGVPMGSELPRRPSAAGAPLFFASALRDPGSDVHPGGKLQRLQMVKGWVGADGNLHQAVYDVAGDAENGASVDLATCEARGPGADGLCAVWEDPDFDPEISAVYYARVVENPSCRWTARQCLALAPEARPAGCHDPRVPKVIQERAWTSPVWYGP